MLDIFVFVYIFLKFVLGHKLLGNRFIPSRPVLRLCKVGLKQPLLWGSFCATTETVHFGVLYPIPLELWGFPLCLVGIQSIPDTSEFWWWFFPQPQVVKFLYTWANSVPQLKREPSADLCLQLSPLWCLALLTSFLGSISTPGVCQALPGLPSLCCSSETLQAVSWSHRKLTLLVSPPQESLPSIARGPC